MANTIATRVTLDGGADVRRDLSALGRAGDDALKRIQSSLGGVRFDRFQQQTQQSGGALKALGQAGAAAANAVETGFRGALKAVQDITNASLGTSFDVIGRNAGIASLSIGALAVAAIGAINSITEVGVKASEKLRETAESLGTTTTAIQRLQAQADEAGVDGDKIVKVLQEIDQAAAQLGARTDLTGNGFRVLGKVMSETGTTIVRGYDKALGEAQKSTKNLAFDVGGATVNVRRGDAVLQDMAKHAKSSGDSLKGMGSDSKDLLGVLRDLNVDVTKFIQADSEGRVDQLRQGVLKQTDALKLNAVAAKFSADGWRDFLKFLQLGEDDVNRVNKALSSSPRFIRPEETDALKDLKDAQKDLEESLERIQVHIAAIFAPGKTASTNFITKLIDDNSKFIQDLLKTKGVLETVIATFSFDDPKAAFGTFGQTISAALRAAQTGIEGFVSANQASLLPVMAKVEVASRLVAAGLSQLTGIKISPFAVQAAAGIAALYVGFKSISTIGGAVVGIFSGLVSFLLALGPLLLPLSVGLFAFWGDIQKGGESAFAAIQAEAGNFKTGILQLLRGDFSGAWKTFEAIGVRTWGIIQKAFEPLVTAVKTGFNTIVGVLNVLAGVSNALFGTQLTASSTAFYLSLIKLSGVIGLIGPLIPALVALLSPLGLQFVAIAGAGIILARLLPQVGAAFKSIGDGLSKLLSGDFAGALSALSAGFSQFWATLSSQSVGTWAILILGAGFAVSRILAAFAPLATQILVPLASGLAAGAATLFAPLITAAAAVGPALGLAVTGGWAIVLAAAIGALAVIIVSNWDAIKAGILQKWEDTKTAVVASVTSMGETINAALSSIGININWDAIGQAIRDVIGGAVDWVAAKVQSFIDSLATAADRLRSLANNSTIGSGTGDALGGAAAGLAKGGLFRGRGTGTSDSNLVWLSTGEFVLRAAAVRKLGLPLLNALNGFKGLSFKDGLPGFAMGGMVPALSLPDLGGVGGGAGRTVNVNLTMPGGETFALMAPEHIADGLTRYASKSAMRSGGPKPSWYR